MNLIILQNISEIAELIAAIGEFLASIAWPVAILIVVWIFREKIKGLIEATRSAKLKTAGIELEVTMENTLLAFLAGSKNLKDTESVEEVREQMDDVTEKIRGIRSQLDVDTSPSILWVDDNPEATADERYTLKVLLDANISTSTTTADALEKLDRNGFNILISDLERTTEEEGEKGRAGVTLYDRVSERDKKPYFILYSKTYTEEIRDRDELDADFDIANEPLELVKLIVNKIKNDNK